MSRADRRRQLRAAGAHRSPNKKGRRSPYRATEAARINSNRESRIVLPSPQEIAAVMDPNALERVKRG